MPSDTEVPTNNPSTPTGEVKHAKILKFSYLLLLIGSLLIAVSEFLEANLAGVHRSLTYSAVFLAALYWPFKPILPTLKKFAAGMKLFFAYFSILAILQVIQATYTPFRAADIVFGMPITGIVTPLTQALPLLAVMTILAYTLKKRQWKLILALQILLILNSLLGFGYILTTPIAELSELTGHELPEELPPGIEEQTRQVIIIPMLIGLSLATLAATYTYRRKDHFENT